MPFLYEESLRKSGVKCIECFPKAHRARRIHGQENTRTPIDMGRREIENTGISALCGRRWRCANPIRENESADLSLFSCSSRRYGPERPSVGRPPGPSAVCRLQSALGLRPRRARSFAGAKGVFPVSVPLGVYRAGNGKRQFELVASGVPHNFTLGGQFRQCGADSGSAHAAEFAQLVQRRRFLELCQSLTQPIHRRGWRGGFDYGTLQNRQGQSRARLSQLERDMTWLGAARCSVERVSWEPLRRI